MSEYVNCLRAMSQTTFSVTQEKWLRDAADHLEACEAALQLQMRIHQSQALRLEQCEAALRESTELLRYYSQGKYDPLGITKQIATNEAVLKGGE